MDIGFVCILAALTVLAYSTRSRCLLPLLAWLGLWVVEETNPAEDVVLEYLDSDSLETEEDEHHGPALKTCQIKAIDHVLAKVGRVRENGANRLMVGKLVREYMLDNLKMRPSHVRRFAPMAIELVFVPTFEEVRAQQVRTTRTKARMNELCGFGSTK